MASGIRFGACSGVNGGITYDDFGPDIPTEIFQLNFSFDADPNRIGFFGENGPPAAVILTEYQDRTHRTNKSGSDLGALINVKYVDANTASVSGVNFPNITDLPGSSGTLLLRFREENDVPVVTQNGYLRATRIVSNVVNEGLKPLNVSIFGFQAADTHGNAGDTSWTEMSDGVGGGSDLAFANQTGLANVHDWVVALSVSPQAVGTNTDFAFWAQVEFL